jgi:PHP family Zn ribbon phosphoesterase
MSVEWLNEATCPKCRCYFKTPQGEEQDHPCPHCGYNAEKEKKEKVRKRKNK